MLIMNEPGYIKWMNDSAIDNIIDSNYNGSTNNFYPLFKTFYRWVDCLNALTRIIVLVYNIYT